MDYLLYLIIAFLLLDYVLERVLEYLNDKNREKELPPEVKDLYEPDKYKKSQEYDRAKQKISLWSGSFSLALTLMVLIAGGFAFLDEWVSGIFQSPIARTLIFFGILFIASDILGLPFSVYSTFVIEEKFGFNRTTTKTFVLDKLKGYLLAIILGGSLLAAIVWFYLWAGKMFWLYAWLIVAAVTLFLTMFYTSLIVPLFNKLKPLEEGELRKAIEDYSGKVNFPLKNIFVIDGSKRSTKANAYFSGIGAKKNIVLFDTLIKDHSKEELVAILAHEVGHYKQKHIRQGFIISTLQIGVMLYLLSVFIDSQSLAGALGANQTSFHIGLLAFSLLYSPISMITGILMNIFSRKNEFEADHYAKITSNGEALQTALKKLSVNHLSNLNPHPAYVFFHYSHPPLLQRLQSLKK